MMLLYHLSVAGLYSFALWYDNQYVDMPIDSEDVAKFPLKARMLFLTVWCLVCQTIYFMIAALNDIIGTNAAAPKNPPLIRKIKDILFSLSFTLAIHVSLGFWLIYTSDKRYIFPTDEMERIIPKWLNHVIHTLITPFILIELLISKRNYPSRKLGLNILFWFSLAYLTFIHLVYYYAAFWPYPFLYNMNSLQRFVFFAVSAVVGFGIYILGEKLNGLISVISVRTSYTNGTKKVQ